MHQIGLRLISLRQFYPWHRCQKTSPPAFSQLSGKLALHGSEKGRSTVRGLIDTDNSNHTCEGPHGVAGNNMGSFMAHDCRNLILRSEKLQQACVKHHLPSRRDKGIDIVGLVDDCKVPLQILQRMN